MLREKSTALRVKATVFLFAVLSMARLAFAVDPLALPHSGSVVAGLATFNYSPANLAVYQVISRALIDWESLNIGENARVEVKQPDSASVAVIRVVNTSTDPTRIQGNLTSNGQIRRMR